MQKYSQKSQKKSRGKSRGLQHVGIERRTLKEEPWRGLNAAAKIFYMHLKGRYNGSNNGEIKLPYSAMRGVKGCSNNHMCSAAVKELEAKEWIKIKMKGGLYRRENFYRLTFKYDLYGAGD